MEKKKEFMVVPDKESGQPIRVEILSTRKFKYKRIYIVRRSEEGNKHVLLVQYKKKGDPAYAWNPSLSWFTDEQVIPFLLFLKKNNMEDDLKKILENIAKGDKKYIGITNNPEMSGAISKLNNLVAAVK